MASDSESLILKIASDAPLVPPFSKPSRYGCRFLSPNHEDTATDLTSCVASDQRRKRIKNTLQESNADVNEFYDMFCWHILVQDCMSEVAHKTVNRARIANH